MRENDDLKYRHEYKYLISLQQLVILNNNITRLLQRDRNTNESGTYHVRSLYFDDYEDSCLRDNINGTEPRKKFRIRIYDCSDKVIKLECKMKNHQKVLKKSCLLSRDQADALIAGDSCLRVSESQPALFNQLILLIQLKKYHPAVIVDYNRVPYIYRYGNSRITFDTDIFASMDFKHFFDKEIHRRPALPDGYHLMEVKYDEFLAGFLYNSLNINHLRATSFSKYCICRGKYISGVIL